MGNEFFFQFDVTPEQVELANKLVDHSIKNHPVEDIYANDPNGKERQKEFRFTGTLGEIVFADFYELPRPIRSFGAINGQDFGQDFAFAINGIEKSFDIKTMKRANNNLRENYVLNLPAYQMRREGIKTDYYFCISIHFDGAKYIASFLGSVSKEAVENGSIGILYEAKTKRIKDDGRDFIFQRDTYEVEFKDISSPILSNALESKISIQKKKLLSPFQNNR